MFVSLIGDGEAEEQHLGSEPCKMSQETSGKIPAQNEINETSTSDFRWIRIYCPFFPPVILHCNLISQH